MCKSEEHIAFIDVVINTSRYLGDQKNICIKIISITMITVPCETELTFSLRARQAK